MRDAAELRLARFAKLQALGLVLEQCPGYPRSITDSVSGGALLLPDNNCPSNPDADPAKNFGPFAPTTTLERFGFLSKLEPQHLRIKTSLTGAKNASLGEGVYMSEDAPTVKIGERLPIFVWGALASGEDLAKLPLAKQQSPGAFAMGHPYTWMVVIVDVRCPAGSRGTNKIVNIMWKQTDRVRELISDGTAHLMIQACAVEDIKV